MRKELLLAIAFVATFAVPSSAGMIDLEFKSVGTFGSSLRGVTAHFSETETYGGSNAWAGQLKVEIIPISGQDNFGLSGIHQVFCTELDEYAGRNTDYKIDTLNNLSIPSTAPAMHPSQKAAIEKLFSMVGEVDTDIEAAGFQVAIWEISQDFAFGTLEDTSMNRGNFYLSQDGSDGTYLDNILTSANGFLTRISGRSQVSVLGMVSDGSQDFVIANPNSQGPTTVPEPASLAFWGLGLIGLSFRRRRA